MAKIDLWNEILELDPEETMGLTESNTIAQMKSALAKFKAVKAKKPDNYIEPGIGRRARRRAENGG